MLPYVDPPNLPWPLHWFGLLVATGVLLGITLARRRAPRWEIDLTRLDSFIGWMLIAGFAGGHIFDEIFYHPEQIVRKPLSLLNPLEGLSSYGGFLGALLGILLWKRFAKQGKGQPLLPYADLILSVFPIAWIFGRAGCSVAHDHPGKLASPSLLTVAYPGGARYDLGVLEMFFAIALSLVVVLMWRRRWPVGTYVALTCLTYAPVRFFLDFLRITEGAEADRRYAGLTPAQWACVALFGFGVYLLARLFNRRAKGVSQGVAESTT
jgi:phosphatidylglycerol---prolipoprotein diacylglyceryl transferase